MFLACLHGTTPTGLKGTTEQEMASGQQLAGAVYSACPSYLLFVSDPLSSLTPVRPGTDARLILDVCTRGYNADASEIAP